MGSFFRLASRIRRAFLHRGWYPTTARSFHSSPASLAFNSGSLSAGSLIDDFDTNESVIHRADEILTGIYRIWNIRKQVARMPDWHKDLLTGFHWNPRRSSIPGEFLRESSPSGALRRVWEMNRHGYLFDLGRAHMLTGEQKYRDLGRQIISDWIEHNPPGTGVNWTSPLESAVRIVSWLEFLRMTGPDTLTSKLRSGIARILYAAAKRTDWDLSLFPNPNNHLAGEALLLLMAGIFLQGASRLKRWRNIGITLLNTYAANQFGEEGSPGEQSPGYLMFVIEIYLYAGYILKTTSSEEGFSHDTRQRIMKALAFLHTLRETLGYIPNVGDNDDAHLLACYDCEDKRLDRLLSLGKRILAIRSPIPTQRRIAADSSVPSENHSPVKSGEESIISQCDGWIAIPPAVESPWGILFLATPLGLPPLYGHGHADALSILISLYGRPVVTDPGTYRYGEKEWRDFFRSTRAHATVEAGNRDQADQVDTFTWEKPYSCSWKVVQDKDPVIIRAGHNGYMRLPEQIVHERILQRSGKTIIIKDSLASSNGREFSASLVWPIHPSVRVDTEENETILLKIRKQECVLTIRGPGLLRISRGDTTPMGGWFSPVFEECSPSTTVIMDASGRQISWRTEFRLLP